LEDKLIRIAHAAAWLVSLAIGSAAAPAEPWVERLRATVRFDLPRHQMLVHAAVELGLDAETRELWIGLADHELVRTEVETIEGDRRFSWVAREQPERRRKVIVLRLREPAGERLPLQLEYRVTAPARGGAELSLQPGALHAAPASRWWPVALAPEATAPAAAAPRRTELRLVVPREFLVHGGGRIEADHEKGKVRHVDLRYETPGPLEPFFLAAPYQRRTFDHQGTQLVLLTLQELPRVPGVVDEVADLIASYRGCAGGAAPLPSLTIAESAVDFGGPGASIGFHGTALLGSQAFAIADGRPRFKPSALRALGCGAE
jgi:hypothetical protein